MDLPGYCFTVLILFNNLNCTFHILYLLLYLVVLVQHVLSLLVKKFKLSGETKLKRGTVREHKDRKSFTEELSQINQGLALYLNK